MSIPGQPTSTVPCDPHALARRHDGLTTALGDPARWPPELRVAVDLMHGARHPALVAWGSAGHLVYNDGYAALLGARHPAAPEHDLAAVVAALWQQGPAIAPLLAAAFDGRAGHLDDAALAAAPDGRSFNLGFSPLRDAAGQVVGIYHTAFELDPGARQRRSEFLAVLAHELRNPMAPIRTGLEIMRLRADSPDTMERVREMLERQTRQMTHLIDDLLDVARVSSGKIEIRKQLVDLNRVVTGALEASSPMIQGARHVFDASLWDEPLLLEIDPTRVAQVVGNLLSNAAKYTPPGGSIRLTVRKARNERTGMDEAVVAVTDSGVGIPAGQHEAIFDMFNQVGRAMNQTQGGLGIGLALVRQLVALHDGSVEASSAGVGQGSTFTVRLPLGARAQAGADEPARPERRAAQRRTYRILVVDDNQDAAESLSLLLQLNAHEIRTATGGHDALALAAGFRPDIAFIDIGMPGMSGFELAARLRAMPELARLTIVAVTGWGSEEDLARSREAGIDHHYTKPIAAETVSRLLSQIE